MGVWKILIILSSTNHNTKKSLQKLSKKIRQIDDEIIQWHTIVDPNQLEIEEIIQEHKYLFVINTCRFPSINRREQKFIHDKFNILQFLNHLDLKIFGNGYLNGLFALDTPAVFKSASKELNPRVFTRLKQLKLNSTFPTEFPVSIRPYSKILIDESKTLIAKSEEEFNSIIAGIFDSQSNVDEIIVHKALQDKIKYTVSIIGNPPRNLCLICKTSADGFQTLKVDETITQELESKALCLFEKYGLKDYGQFEFKLDLRQENIHLSNLDFSNVLNDDILFYLLERYEMRVPDILKLLLLIYFTSRFDEIENNLIIQLATDLPNAVVSELMPLNLIKNINKNYSYKDVQNELRKRFLSPNEDNRKQIMKMIETSFSKIPNPNRESPFLGRTNSGHSFLEKYEMIPEEVQNDQIVLNESMQVLDGQLRWHSPSVLFNVFPATMLNTIASSTIINTYNPVAMTKITSAGVLKMEKQIVRQIANLIGWNKYEATGTFTYGGKACMAYGIKLGLNRSIRNADSDKSPVVICSQVAHFSIESICLQLGISQDSVIRIPLASSRTIDFVLFEKCLQELLEAKVPIACIVLSGGNTTHNEVEDIKKVYNIVERLKEKFSLNYFPFLYFDLVVGWPWLFYKYYDFGLNNLKIDPVTIGKIKIVYDGIKNSHLIDAAGIDFHKGGFSPHTNSLFVTRQASDLHLIFDNKIDEGNREPFHYTFSNSRGSTAIVAAWNVLQSIGIEGFQAYIANMVSVAGTFANTLPHHGFEVLRKDESTGFATIIWSSMLTHINDFSELFNADKSSIQENNKLLYYFTKYLSDNEIDSENKHYFVRFLDGYEYNTNGVAIAAFALLPMTIQITNEKASNIVNDMGYIRNDFLSRISSDPSIMSGSIPIDVPR
ncbi:pyridoxal-dependent decarboxylase [Flavivirga jejuensis]|uniref:Pyridoxal-dependent decarboxylase n=1 Tax=Flavivirga jejuensis TaxID=870487 RepID=A0ABT8WVR7_9FLAO|nr:pyridoxal-dependent decarboxylase [Flavivirga jejuensis]MDO5977254.1 pyridoxal-dependent decarboxylase [Flavivirga jejuensis]